MGTPALAQRPKLPARGVSDPDYQVLEGDPVGNNLKERFLEPTNISRYCSYYFIGLDVKNLNV